MPYYITTLHTPLPPAQAAAALAATSSDTQESGLASFWPTARDDVRPFIGSVDADGFQLRRRIGYRNFFLPRLTGTFVPAANGGTMVRIHMRLAWPVYAFMAIYLAYSTYVVSGAGHSSVAGMAWLFPVFFLVLTLAGFIPEAVLALRRLRQILESE